MALQYLGYSLYSQGDLITSGLNAVNKLVKRSVIMFVDPSGRAV